MWYKFMKNIEIGQKFGKLTVVGFDDNDKNLIYCKCDCGNYKYIKKNLLISGGTKSCGCLRREMAKTKLKHIKDNDLWYRNRNKYSEVMEDENGKFIMGYTTNKQDKFFIDLNNYEKIKDYAWRTYIDKRNGFKSVCTTIVQKTDENIKYKRISLQHFLGYYYCDHIDRNELNNRICNLRKCNQQQNTMNSTKSQLNTSRIIGVSFDKRNDCWIAYITVNKERKTIWGFKTKEEATKARLEAEAKYFGEFSPQIHLFEEYGIPVPRITSLADDNKHN